MIAGEQQVHVARQLAKLRRSERDAKPCRASRYDLEHDTRRASERADQATERRGSRSWREGCREYTSCEGLIEGARPGSPFLASMHPRLAQSRVGIAMPTSFNKSIPGVSGGG
jgi:hypothetical protein